MKTQLLAETSPPGENTSHHHHENGLELSLSMPLASYGRQSLKDDAKGGTTTEAPSTEVKVTRTTGPMPSHYSHAGPSSGSSINMGWFSNAAAGGGSVQPWSLAARREMAAFEQKPLDKNLGRRPPIPPRADITSGPQPIPVVGWPPVRATRKNIAGPRPSKTGMEAAVGKEPKKAKTRGLAEEEDGEEKGKEGPISSTMFVKVNMEGLAVGRKIDLMAHDGYRSLSRAVRTMFDNFLPGKQTAKCLDKSERGELEDADLILLYEDDEGDKMLVGDLPWKMFVGSVKRLYITYRTKAYFPVNGEQAKEENEQCTTNLAG